MCFPGCIRTTGHNDRFCHSSKRLMIFLIDGDQCDFREWAYVF